MSMRKLFTAFTFMLLTFNFSVHGTGQPTQALNSGWQFRQYNIGKWLEATVPGTVHTDLLVHELIPDPFFRMDEQEVQWIDKVNWEYETIFQPSKDILGKANQQLIFHGLDTYADIFLNGENIGEVDNMFRTWKLDVTGKLKAGDNKLNIRFYSPITKGIEKLEEYGLALPADNDYSQYGGMGKVRVSVFTRKAPYHYGWDWGPRLVPSGIWRPVELEGWSNAKVEDVFIKQPSVTAKQANLEAEVTVMADKNSKIKVEILHNNKILAGKEVDVRNDANTISLPFTIKNPRLWWSNGLGEQNLYDFTVRVSQGTNILDEYVRTTGIRDLRLVREKDEKGETFYFSLNGIPVFAKGANYIPNDIFLPRVTRTDYEKVVNDAAQANMNMLRIWGGGIYEDDYFYELCDRKGIMIWQDFMFACAMYPDTPEFLESVRHEAEDNIKRLRNHPCIALWCGNNEVDVAWARWGWKRRYSQEDQDRISKAYITMAHELLPEMVEKYTDGADYWPSSPMSGPEIGAHEIRRATSGDNHYWGVWFEKHRFEQFEENIGRFISEYGFQSFPEFNTVKKYTIPEDYDIYSPVMEAHQRSFIGNHRITEYMEMYYDVPEDFEQFLYMSQVLQGRAMHEAFHAHRRNMPYCMGSLMWQHNDCWPVASWSTTDYYHNWKAAHYAARNACKPLMISPRIDEGKVKLWAISDILEKRKTSYSIEVMDFDGNIINKKNGTYTVMPNRSAVIADFNTNDLLNGRDVSETLVVFRLSDGNKVLDEQICYFTEPKNLNIPKTVNITKEVITKNGQEYLRVTTDRLACNVWFYIPDKKFVLEDNYIDLLPGRTYDIAITSSDGTVKAGDIQFRKI